MMNRESYVLRPWECQGKIKHTQSCPADMMSIPSHLEPTRERRWRSVEKRSRREYLLRKFPDCIYCRVPLTPGTATMDHYIPRSKGGKNSNSNIVLSCLACNASKADRLPLDFVVSGDYRIPEYVGP